MEDELTATVDSIEVLKQNQENRRTRLVEDCLQRRFQRHKGHVYPVNSTAGR